MKERWQTSSFGITVFPKSPLPSRASLAWVAQDRAKAEEDKVAPWPKGKRPWSARLSAIAQLLFQFWFNFAGGCVGWIGVWLLWRSDFEDYGWKHFVVFIIAFVGVTGNLPHLSTGIRAALAGIAKRMGGD